MVFERFAISDARQLNDAICDVRCAAYSVSCGVYDTIRGTVVFVVYKEPSLCLCFVPESPNSPVVWVALRQARFLVVTKSQEDVP